MKLRTEVRCSTISQLPRCIDIMKDLGWTAVECSRSDFLFRFETSSAEAVGLPPSLTFKELEKIAEDKTKKGQS